MSADTPSYSQAYDGGPDTKYAVGNPQILRDPGAVAFTHHAAARYRDRINESLPMPVVGPRTAWTRGEWVKHPVVCESDDAPPLEAVRAYKDGDGWGVAFLVTKDPYHERHPDFVPLVVCTVNSFRGFYEAPTRAYLRAHGPHDGGDGR